MLDRRSVNVSAPYIFPPSGSFSGSDGAWSTFFVNVGDSGEAGYGQEFEVLVSTAASTVIVPLEADWCTVPDADTCARSRGVTVWNGQQSRGFQQETPAENYQSIGLYTLSLQANLNHGPDDEPRAQYGYTTVGLGVLSEDSPQLPSQLVAAVVTRNFPMGYFGLSTTPVKLTNAQYETFLTNFTDEIPSRSYGYTAGALYRNNGVFANLVLGGYDAARVGAQSTSFSMPGQGNHTLIVGVQSILVNQGSNSDVFSLTNTGFTAQIDSTLPYLWLPDSICDGFEELFGLEYDNETRLYTVNDSAHARNVEANASITFNIGRSPLSDGDFTSISLPYAAFDLEASFPIYETPTRYFPIKRSPTNSFVLGRTFLQESYLIVDYERENFTVAPASFLDPMPSPDVVPILSTSFFPVEPTPPSSSSGLSTGSIVGIVIAVFVAVLAAAIGGFIWYRRRKRQPVQETPVMDHTDAKSGHMSEASELAAHPSFLRDIMTPYASSPYGSYTGHTKVPLQPLQPAEMEAPIQQQPPPSELESPPLHTATQSSLEPGYFGRGITEDSHIDAVSPTGLDSTENTLITPTHCRLPDGRLIDETLQRDSTRVTPADEINNEELTLSDTDLRDLSGRQ